MKRLKIKLTALLAVGAMALSLAACGGGQPDASARPAQSSSPVQSGQPQRPGDGQMPGGMMPGQSSEVDLSNIGTDLPNVEYTEQDLSGDWGESAKEIALGNEDVTITKGGAYILSGTLADGQILVDADEDEVQIVLNGADITNSDGPALYVKKAGKVYITLVGGTVNTLSDGASYQVEGDENEPDACVFSKADLTINGSGNLTVNGNYDGGIVTKDDLVVAGGTIRVTALEDGVKGKDSVAVCGGSLTVEAGDDGVSASNDEDADKGWLSMDGGSLTVSVGGDGVHAEGALVINGGVIHILKSEEGLEGRSITLNGGDVVLTAADDGVNAAGGVGSVDSDSMQASPVNYIHVAGGSLWVNAGGDGIDANGALLVEGGSVFVSQSGQADGALDTGSGAVITGGIVVAAGSSQMGQNFATASTQRSFLYNFDSVCAAGTLLTVTAADGTEIVTFAPELDYQCVVVSTPELADGTYTVSAGDRSGEITLAGMTASNSGMMGAMGGGQRPQGMTPPTGEVSAGVTPPPEQGV